MLDEKQKEALRTLTMEVLLDLRASYLGTSQANALKNWDLLQDRMRAAARTSSSPEEWATAICRGLQLPALNNSASRDLTNLVQKVAELDARGAWLDLIEAEHGYLIALARLTAEGRKEAREAAAEEQPAKKAKAKRKS